VLDEFDVLSYDKRGKPSDFIYKLLVMEEKLREKGYLMCIIAISNNVMSDYEINDRVRSRIGTSEVFFEPYKPQAVLVMLKNRAEKAFSETVDSEKLRYREAHSSEEHADARRAIDLLRIAAEIARKRGEKISKKHIDQSVGQLQKDRISTTLSSASYHLKLAAAALARISYLKEEVWRSTSTLYDQYRHIISKDGKQLTYRRFSELLTELENMGLVVSHTSSKGRHGYGTQYKLVVSPEIVGKTCFPD
jgi:cell division control protein 6